jgi:hypothetical protein
LAGQQQRRHERAGVEQGCGARSAGLHGKSSAHDLSRFLKPRPAPTPTNALEIKELVLSGRRQPAARGRARRGTLVNEAKTDMVNDPLPMSAGGFHAIR